LVSGPTNRRPIQPALNVRDGAANAKQLGPTDEVAGGILELARAIESGQMPEAEMVLAADSPLSRHIVVEGHNRATAFVIAQPPVEEVEVIVGYSKGVRDWDYF
jgi:hypothetical protein